MTLAVSFVSWRLYVPSAGQSPVAILSGRTTSGIVFGSTEGVLRPRPLAPLALLTCDRG